MSTMAIRESTVTRSPLRWGAVAGAALFFAASVVVGALTPGYSPVREMISGLAAKDNSAAGLMIAGFVAGAIAFASVAALYWKRFAGGAGRVAAVMFGIAGAALLTAGFARQDCSEFRPGCIDAGEATLASTSFWVHQFVSLAMFVLLTAAMFVLARGLKRSAGYAHLAVPTRIVGGLLVVGTLALVSGSLAGYTGLAQRVYLGLMVLWPVAVAVLPARPTTPSQP